MIILVAAASKNNALGKDNGLLWHLPDDFKRFKEITTGHYIIMGRKTFESFPKLLPNRTHIIITRNKDYHTEGCIIAENLEAALKSVPENEDAYIIGGGEIYKLALPLADVVDLTKVHQTFEADTFFPELDQSQWDLEWSQFHPSDDRHQYDFTFQRFVRKHL